MLYRDQTFYPDKIFRWEFQSLLTQDRDTFHLSLAEAVDPGSFRTIASLSKHLAPFRHTRDTTDHLKRSVGRMQPLNIEVQTARGMWETDAKPQVFSSTADLLHAHIENHNCTIKCQRLPFQQSLWRVFMLILWQPTMTQKNTSCSFLSFMCSFTLKPCRWKTLNICGSKCFESEPIEVSLKISPVD